MSYASFSFWRVCVFSIVSTTHPSVLILVICNGGDGTHDVGQLCFSDQILRLCSNELLLQRHELRALRLLILQLLDLIRDLRLMIPTRLHRALRIPDLLQDSAIVLQILRKHVLLLAQLGQQHAQLVGDVGDGVVARGLAPVRELSGDGDALAAGGLVGADGVVLAFDHLEELLAELGLLYAPEGGHGEAVFGCAFFGAAGRGIVFFGAHGE